MNCLFIMAVCRPWAKSYQKTTILMMGKSAANIVVIIMLIRFLFQRLNSLFIQVNCIHFTILSNTFSKSKRVVACVTAEISNDLTLSYIGFNLFLRNRPVSIQKPFDWIIIYLVFCFLLFINHVSLFAPRHFQFMACSQV